MINHQILRWIWWRIWWWIWWITRWGDEFITIFGDVVSDDFCYLHQIESSHKSIFPTKKHSEGKRHPTNTRSWTFRGKKTSHYFGDIFITKFGWWFWCQNGDEFGDLQILLKNLMTFLWPFLSPNLSNASPKSSPRFLNHQIRHKISWAHIWRNDDIFSRQLERIK